MSLTIKQVENIANLSRLALTDAEKKSFTQDLNQILAYVEKLQSLDTEGVEPLTHILSDYNVFRADVVRTDAAREELLANAPLVEAAQFKVPKIM